MLTRPRNLVLLLALAAPALAHAQTADHSQEAVVIEQARSAYRFEKDGTGGREFSLRLRTQSEAGVQQWGQLMFGYNAANERLDVQFVRVRKPDGSIVTTSPDAVQDLTAPVQRVAPVYTDFRQKHVTVEGLRPGDTLEFTVVTIVHTALAPGHFWMEYEFNRDAIVLREQLEIDVPADQAVTLKTRAGHDPTTTQSGGRRIHRWTTSNLTRPAESDKEKDVKIPEEPQSAAVRLTTFQSWEQVGRWYAELEAPQRVPTEEIRRKAAELTAGRKSDLEKLEALYEFVAINFRYVSLSLGLGRYQPRRPSDVLRDQYGDCKDKHTLLASLIEAAGLRASTVLINGDAKIDPAFPSPSQFNHVITKAGASGEDVWVDTTTEVAPFRLLAPALRKQQGLVVDATGTPRLEETPANPPMKSLLLQEIDGKLGEAGNLDARLTLTFRGDVELLMRTIFRSTPAAHWKAILEKSFGKDGPREAQISNWKVSDPAALKDPFRIEVDTSFGTFVNWSAGKASVALPLSESFSPPDDTTTGDRPIELGAAPHEISYKVRLQLPPGVTVRTPLPVSITRDYAEYRAAYTVEGSTFSAERALLLRQSELPAARKDDYAAFMRVVAADGRQQLAFTSRASTAAIATADLNAAELSRNGYAALDAGNYNEAATLLTRLVELEPKHKTGWTHLGRAYMGLRQYEAAIGAFQKQIAVNPYDAFAYNNLGHAHATLQQYDEAEAAFRKQLEINPLDQFAPASLGAISLERRRYDAALPHFEQAATLRPEDAWLQVQLGKTYLHVDREADAVKAFDRAVEIAPTPTTWNNVAYELAQKGVQLERALQYAESAVSSATAASRTLDVARADAGSFGVAASLAAYWDTLGWVQFARGDFARAEPLVEASWRLAQHPEVGDHLAQIQEKLGRRNDAMKTYAMALAAKRASDEIRDRLARIAGGDAKVEELVEMHRAELTNARTFRIPGVSAPGKHADFVVLFSAAAGAEAVRFVGGDEALRPFASAIQKASYGRMFPDGSPAKLLRRGILACSEPGAACTLTLLLPQDTEPVK